MIQHNLTLLACLALSTCTISLTIVASRGLSAPSLLWLACVLKLKVSILLNITSVERVISSYQAWTWHHWQSCNPFSPTPAHWFFYSPCRQLYPLFHVPGCHSSQEHTKCWTVLAQRRCRNIFVRSSFLLHFSDHLIINTSHAAIMLRH